MAAPLVLAGCYEGLDPRQDAALTDGGLGPFGTTSAGEPEDSDGEGSTGAEALGPPPSLRLLSASEYRRTIEDLLLIPVDDSLSWGDNHTGFDNGSNAFLDESLLALLLLQTEQVSAAYVEQRLILDHPCFAEVGVLTPACVQGFVESMGFRAYRRPLTDEDRLDFETFIGQLQSEAPSATELAELLLVKMLMSPRFLFRVEGGRDGNDTAGLDPFDRATLIAYTVTGTMPDALLFADALDDTLDDDTTVAHVRRLMQTPRGQEHMRRFAVQWFRLDALDRMRDTPEAFTKLTTPELGASFAAEFEAFVDGTLLADGTLADLLLSDSYTVDTNTAPLYGAPSPATPDRIPIVAPPGRRGVLGLASVMAAHSSATLVHRDAPVQRGLMIKNRLLCEHVGLPSGIDITQAAEDVQDQVEDFEALTTREQFELIMNQGEQCIACHQTFMPYGFLASSFDALGQQQTHFGDRLLDTRVEALNLDGMPGDYADLDAFASALADSDQLARCYTQTIASFITGSASGELTDTLVSDFDGFSSDEAMTELFEQMLTHPALLERTP